jgi:tripartite-type tricarboxylate transporter receptor subunit TctC
MMNKPYAARRALLATALFAGALALAPASHADSVLKLVVPFAPGGPVDQMARLIAPSLGQALGESVVVENRAGAGGTIGAAYVAKSPPDGNTLLVSTLSFVMTAGTTPHLAYDPKKDFKPVYMVGEVQTLLVARNDLNIKSPADLVKMVKDGKHMSFGSSGVGSTMQIGGELFNEATGTKSTHVPYRGAAPALIDLMAGRIDFLNADVPVLQPYVKDGRVTGVVIYDDKRSPYLPNIPDAKEAHLPELMMTNAYGILAPAGVPPARLKVLEAAFNKIVHEPELAKKLKDAGFDNPQDSANYGKRLTAELDRWVPFIHAHGIKTE